MAKNFNTNLVLGGKLNPSLSNTFNRASKMADTNMKKISKAGSIASKVISIAGLAMGSSLAIGAAAAAKKGIELASSLTEVQNVVDTTFGSSASKINSWSQKALKVFGLSDLQAKQYSSTLGAMLKSSGLTGQSMVTMSEKLSGLTGDLASFYNLSQDEAFEKIRAGISGETEPLKALGINMSEANLQAFALSKGIKTSYSNMDQASQTVLRYSYLMDKSKDAQGDFAKTQGSFANQTRLLKTNFQQLSAKLMSAAIPTISKILEKGNKFFDLISSNPSLLSGLQNGISNAFSAIGNFLSPVMDLAIKFAPVLSDIFKTMAQNSPIKVIFGLLQTMAPAIIDLIKQIMPTLSTVFGMLSQAMTQVAPLIGELISSILPLVPPILSAIVSVIQPLLPLFLQMAQALLPSIIQLVQALLPIFQELTPIIAAIAKIISVVLAVAIENTIPIMQNFIQIIKGIIDGVGKVIGKIGKFLGLSGGTVDLQTSVSSVPKYAVGGIATRPSIFGDAGPEIAIPLKRTPRSQALLQEAFKVIGPKKSGNPGNNYNFTINVTSKSNDVPTMAKSIKEAVKEAIEEIEMDRAAVSFV